MTTVQYRSLGKSGLEVSTLAFGAWQIGDAQYWGTDDQADYEAAVRTAVDAGITLFDTAEMYGAGQSEIALGRALGASREHVLIASKVSVEHAAPDAVRRACEQSLQRLGTDRIDLYQIHWPARDVPFEDTCGALEQLRCEGKIRAIGISNFGVADMAQWFRAGDCVSNQLGYSLAFRAIEHDILPACRARQIGVLAYMPLLQGILSCRWKTIDEMPPSRRRTRHFAPGRPGVRHTESSREPELLALLDGLASLAAEVGHAPATLALAWLIAQPGITAVLVGARNPRQLQRNLAAAVLQLPPDVTQKLDTLSTPLKTALGNNPDHWDTVSRIR